MLDGDAKHRARLLLILLTVPFWITAGAYLGERIEGGAFSEYYSKRYKVIQGVSEVIKYAPTDGRMRDINDALDDSDRWLWFGVGFAGTFGDPSGQWSETGRFADSMLLDFATRFGVSGVILLGWFILITLRLAKRPCPPSECHPHVNKTIGAGLIGLIASSFLGNAFASSYMGPVAMTAFTLFAASSVLHAYDSPHARTPSTAGRILKCNAP
jgi:hypothetical protein